MGSIAGFTAQQTSDLTFGLTEPLLTSKLKFGDDRPDNVDLGRSSGTDLGLEDENLNCSQIAVWAADDSDVVFDVKTDVLVACTWGMPWM